MVQFVQAGPQAFDMLLYPEQSPLNSMYIQEQLSRFSNTLTEAGQRFMSESKKIYEQIQDSELLQKTRAAIRTVQGYFHPNAIVSLETMESMQAASPVMQRYIMAMPEIRELYQKQLIYGYQDTYADVHSGVGVEHYDYRRVMTGMAYDTHEGEEWCVSIYPDELIEGDRELLFTEKCDILRTWDYASIFLAAAEKDPTDPLGGEMG